ncbi:hypothetical protein PS15m_006456 [Mucor circinelloides]
MFKPNHFESVDTELKAEDQSRLASATWNKPHQVEISRYSKPDAYSLKGEKEEEQYYEKKAQNNFLPCIVFTRRKIALIGVALVGVLVLSICLPVILIKNKNDDAKQQNNTTSSQSGVGSNSSSTRVQFNSTTTATGQMPSTTAIKQMAGELITTYYVHDSETQNCKTVLTLRDNHSANKLERNVTATSCLTVPVGQYSFKTVDAALLYVWQPTCFKQGNVSAITLNSTYINVTDYRFSATSIFSVSC